MPVAKFPSFNFIRRQKQENAKNKIKIKKGKKEVPVIQCVLKATVFSDIQMSISFSPINHLGLVFF